MQLENQKVFIENERVHLTLHQFNILWMLLKRKGDIVPRSEIIKTVWEGVFVEERTCDCHVSKLNKAIKEANIKVNGWAGNGYIAMLKSN